MLDYPQSAITLVLRDELIGGRQATLTAAGAFQIALLEEVIGNGLLADEI
jgi:hypothetical protein